MGLFGRQRQGSSDSLSGFAIANRRLVSGVAPAPVVAGELPRYLYCEEPDTPGDSGWRLFTGDETEADADDPGTFQVNAVETLLAVHPQLAQVLRPGVSGAWEWDDRQGRYVPVPA